MDAAAWLLSVRGESWLTRLRYMMHDHKKLDRRLTLIWLEQELKRYQRVA
jgi:hypothetical protein